MKILLTGATGQLGLNLITTKPSYVKLICPNKSELNLENSIQCFDVVSKYKPDWVINCGAYTNVDGAEKEIDKAFLINRDAPRSLAKAIKTFGGQILHISTDFVFNGRHNKPYKIEDKIDPINVYGLSKAEGEANIEEYLKETNQSLILRTSWLMGPRGNNFASKMLQLHKQKEVIKVVNDQFGSPTSTISLSMAIWLLIEKYSIKSNLLNLPSILHWSDLGIASWFDIAISVGEIADNLEILNKPAKVIPIASDEYITNAKRPKNSVLDSSLCRNIINLKGNHWRKMLERVINEMNTKKIYN